MIVLVLECVREGYRGEVTRWLMELRAGIYAGNVSAAVRERLWNKTLKETEENGGSGLMLYSADTEQGFDMRMTGMPSRQIIDMEGLKLVSTILPEQV